MNPPPHPLSLPPLSPLLRHRDFWPSLPGQTQREQGLLRPQADEDPGRDPTEAGAARPQREGSADRSQPPLPHSTVSLHLSAKLQLQTNYQTGQNFYF